MFEYLTGQIKLIAPNYLVLEVGAIGFRIIVGNPYHYQEGQQVTIYVEQVIRDSDQVLYGFRNQSEKDLFDRLTSVSGIGPKSAIAILASDDHQGLVQAICSGDVKFLTRFPGVGKKTAQQIILDLKDKLTPDISPAKNNAQPVPSAEHQELNDGLAALAALGYSQRDLNKIEPKLKDLTPTSADAYVRAGLKLLSR